MDSLPIGISRAISQSLELDLNTLEEIRLRANKPIILKNSMSETVLNYIVSTEDLLNILQKICDNSIYTYQEEICNGFITISGGHRVGMTGEAVYENGKVKNLKYISSLNFRIARQIKGVADDIIQEILDINNNSIKNTLIVGPPGSGKTTLLKDMIRQISDGIPKYNFAGITVGVADERGEISAMNKGVSENDLGIRTDVINNLKKSIAIEMLVRSMSPKVIVSDEIGDEEDIDAITYALCSGVKCIFTAHGDDFESIKLNPIFSKMIEQKFFQKIIFLLNEPETKNYKIINII